MLRYLASYVGLGGGGPDREQSLPDRVKMWYKTLEDAESYGEWLTAAKELDELEGMEDWKREPASGYYDAELIRGRLAELNRLEAEGDTLGILYWLRSGIVRNLGGTGNPELYNHSLVGTKRLIEQHDETLVSALKAISVCDEKTLPLEKRLSFFTESRHALGKTALMLSGGASLGMYHFGVIRALFLQGLLPRVLSGSSAGSIVMAIIGVRTHEELSEMFSGSLEALQKGISLEFFDPAGGLKRKIVRLLTKGVLMDVTKLQAALRQNVGDVTFAEAYERTGRIMNISVSPGNSFEKPRLLNYLTAPNVLVWSAASASCALPGLFEAVELVAKNGKGLHVPYHISNVKWTDGSLHSDLPINRLKELFNVNYFIVSQTNPHALPFLQRFQRKPVAAAARLRKTQPGVFARLYRAAAFLVRSEMLHRCNQLICVGLAPNFLHSLINQTYLGDVTIIAPLSIKSYKMVISNPTSDSLMNFLRVAERHTWPNIAHVRSQTQLEQVLDQCVRTLAQEAQIRASRPRQLRLKNANSNSSALEYDDEVVSPLNIRRHTHLDLSNYFGTATLRNNSSQNLSELPVSMFSGQSSGSLHSLEDLAMQVDSMTRSTSRDVLHPGDEDMLGLSSGNGSPHPGRESLGRHGSWVRTSSGNNGPSGSWQDPDTGYPQSPAMLRIPIKASSFDGETCLRRTSIGQSQGALTDLTSVDEDTPCTPNDEMQPTASSARQQWTRGRRPGNRSKSMEWKDPAASARRAEALGASGSKSPSAGPSRSPGAACKGLSSISGDQYWDGDSADMVMTLVGSSQGGAASRDATVDMVVLPSGRKPSGAKPPPPSVGPCPDADANPSSMSKGGGTPSLA